MKILDRYILKKFLSTFLFVVAILVAIIVIIDITEKNDKFIKHGLTLAEILPYYLSFIPFVANLITPITVFIATVFVTSKMAQHTEIIAILSSGVSFRRMIVPYMIGAAIIGALSFYLNGWVIPNANKTRVAFEVQYVKRPFNYSEKNIHRKVGDDVYIYMESYNNHSNKGYRFTIEKIKENNLLEKLEAKSLEWNQDSSRWLVKDWKKRVFVDMEEIVTEGKELDTAINILPEDFESDYRKNETLTMTELDDHVDTLQARGADNAEVYQIEKYVRYMAPFTVIILTFIGLTVSSRKTRGGAGFQIALGFLIAFIFIIFFIFSKSIAEKSSTPILAVWIPNIVFSIVGLILYKLVPR